MKSFEFTLVLRDVSELTVEIADALFEAGCYDGSPGSASGVTSIDFDRESGSLESAINSAITDVKRAGFKVARIEIDSGLEALAS